MTEFATWVIWLGLFALLQRRLCLRYPGIRTACRGAFAVTAVAVVVPAIWALLHPARDAAANLRQVSHYFGMGVYLQITLRALIEMKWLAVAPLGFSPAAANPDVLARREQKLVQMMSSLPDMLRSSSAGEDPS